MKDEQLEIHSKKDNLDFFSKNTKDFNIPLEVNLDESNINFFNDPMPENIPAPLEQSYGFFKNIYHGGLEPNAIHSIVEFSQRKIADSNPLDDTVSENWKPNIDDLNGIDPRRKKYIMQASGPKDFSRRKNYVLDQMDEQRRIEDGSTLGRLAGGFTLGNADPMIFLPIAKAMKYATVSKTFMEAIPKVLPGVGLASISHEAVMQSTQLTGNWEDFIINSFAETALGTVFMGGVAALPTLVHAGKVFNAKNVLNMQNKGIEPRPILNDKGVVVGWKATPMDNSVGAAEVNLAQTYLDGAMAKNSLYAIPYFGENIGYAAGKTGQILGGWISPQLRMATSTFETMRGFRNHIAESGFETEGVAQGRAQPDTFEGDLDQVKAKNVGIKNVYDGYFMAHNGITYDPETFGSRSRAILQTKLKSKTQENWEDENLFGRKVNNVMITKKYNDSAEVNNAANFLTETQLKPYMEWRSLNGISEKIFPPKTANGYATRSYNHPYLTSVQGEESWLKNNPIELKKYDDEIISLTQPIQNAKNSYKKMKEENASKEQLDEMKKHIKTLQDKLQNDIRENHDLYLHVEDVNALSAKEANQIIKLNEPIKKLEKEYKLLKKNLKEENDKLKLIELKDKIDQAKLYLEDKMANGEIDQVLYYKIKDSQRYALKDPKNRLKFRKPYKSDFERQQIVKAQLDSIMNNTSADLINNILHSMFPSTNTDSLKPRSVMYRDTYLHDNNFLHPNPVISVMNYNLALGRKISYQKMLNRLTINGTEEELVERLRKEYETKKNDLKKNFKDDNKKLENKTRKLNRQYKVAQSDMKNSFEKMLGKTKGGPKIRAFSNMANLFAVSTKLGFLPFTMSTDLMANVFKHGFWPFVFPGLEIAFKSFGGILNTEEGKLIRANAAHALLAENHMALTYSDRNWMGTSQDYIPIQGKILSALEKTAHFSMNFSGANQIQNLNEMTSALIVQSKIMNSMQKFLSGELKLGNKDYTDLLKYGLDPKDWAERFVNGWKETGKSGIGHGSALAKYWEWSDINAANKMSKAIYRAVKDTIIKRGMFDAPFALDDPLINSVFLFKGYVFASLNRYLIPLLQRPDANKIMGTLFMMAVGSTQNPLRRIINGQDPMEEKDHMLRNALRDGGVFSIISDGWQDINFLTSNYFQDLVSNERYRNRMEMGVFNGPIGGIANDITKIIGMTASGELNQNDLKRLTTLMPIANSWQFRALNTKMIESTGYPKTRYQANKLKEAE